MSDGFLKVGITACLLGFFIYGINSNANEIQCNGSSSLCGMKYNEVTYLMTHNAESDQENWLLNLLPGSNINNQTLDMSQQMKDGVRAMKMPVHSYANQTWVCHGMGRWVKQEIKQRTCSRIEFLRSFCNEWIDSLNPCRIDPGSKTLANALKVIQKFIKENPNEILTLFLEDDAGDLAAIFRSFEEAQLTSRMHHQHQDKSWPTLQEMIQSEHRLVVFVNRTTDYSGRKLSDFRGLNSTSYFVWSSPYHFESVEELVQDTPLNSDLTKSSFLNRNQEPTNKLWLLQHFVTPTLAGNEKAAQIVNQSEFIHNRMNKYKNIIGTKPNYISIDFYHLPQAANGASTVVNQLNQIHLRMPASSNIAGKVK